MTEEEKQLLLQDLSARLPYGVYISPVDCGKAILIGIKDGNPLLWDTIQKKEYDKPWDIEYIKPYLRPMSDMTKEEEDEWCDLNIDPLLEAVGERHTRIEDLMLRAKSQYNPVDWLNAHHFDYRGLISMGLAIEVTSENNSYKK